MFDKVKKHVIDIKDRIMEKVDKLSRREKVLLGSAMLGILILIIIV